MKRILLWLIVFYQKQISPLHPGCCRFVPTCSEYALEAIQTWGAVRGWVWPYGAYCAATPCARADMIPCLHARKQLGRKSFELVTR